ncbi:hypothetical protein KA183_14955 [bacterium]|nr:hypothetical protein [bacterium]
MPSIQITNLKEKRDFVLYSLGAQFAIMFLIYCATPGYVIPLLNNPIARICLLIAFAWQIFGIGLYIFSPLREDRHFVLYALQRVVFFALFMLPPNLLFFLGPAVSSHYYYDDFSNRVYRIGRMEYSPPYVPTPTARPMFYARHDIPKGSIITAKDLSVFSEDTKKYPDVILATKENYYGNGSSDKILLGRKAARDLLGNAPISYFDVEPPYPHQ